MTAVIARILLRYAAGALIMKGLISSDMGADLGTDPDVLAVLEIALGAAVAATTEAFYWAARKFGWSK
jgi:hypothetical protein